MQKVAKIDLNELVTKKWRKRKFFLFCSCLSKVWIYTFLVIFATFSTDLNKASNSGIFFSAQIVFLNWWSCYTFSKLHIGHLCAKWLRKRKQAFHEFVLDLDIASCSTHFLKKMDDIEILDSTYISIRNLYSAQLQIKSRPRRIYFFKNLYYYYCISEKMIYWREKVSVSLVGRF
jgi:hypothetical protein